MLDRRDEDWIVNLEQTLRQTRREQNRLIQERDDLRRLSSEVTPEQERITREIDALEKIAKQTETEIYGFLAMLRTNQG